MNLRSHVRGRGDYHHDRSSSYRSTNATATITKHNENEGYEDESETRREWDQERERHYYRRTQSQQQYNHHSKQNHAHNPRPNSPYDPNLNCWEDSHSIASSKGEPSETLPLSSSASVGSHVPTQTSRFPHASYSSAASEAAKSDIATVCSESVVEDFDVASVTSGDTSMMHSNVTLNSTTSTFNHITNSSVNFIGATSMNGTATMTLNVKMGLVSNANSFTNLASTSSASANTHTPNGIKLPPINSASHTTCTTLHLPIGTSTSTMLEEREAYFRHNIHDQKRPFPSSTASIAASHGSAREGSIQSLGSKPPSINDMGPPIPRMLLGSSATASQAGSVHSSTGVPSDVVTKDVELEDDGASMEADMAEMEVQSLPSTFDDGNVLEQRVNNSHKEEKPNTSIPENPLFSSTSSGRISPGGTVYKGRGVRRYLGRYMHLPLKRFHQNGAQPLDTDDENTAPSPPPFRRNSRSRSRSRSVSRSRSRSRSWSRSPSPPVRRSSWSRNRNPSRSLSRSPSPNMRSNRNNRRGYNSNHNRRLRNLHLEAEHEEHYARVRLGSPLKSPRW